MQQEDHGQKRLRKQTQRMLKRSRENVVRSVKFQRKVVPCRLQELQICKSQTGDEAQRGSPLHNHWHGILLPQQGNLHQVIKETLDSVNSITARSQDYTQPPTQALIDEYAV